MLEVHKVLMKVYPESLIIIVPRHPLHGQEIGPKLLKKGLHVALRSCHERIMPWTNVYVADTLGELRDLYRLSPVAVIGGSFLPGLNGHNISEAAAAGCAVLTGHHVGHFSDMIVAMKRSNPLSVRQVSGILELEEALRNLFNDSEALKAHRMAAKQAYTALSSGIATNIYNLLDYHVIKHAVS